MTSITLVLRQRSLLAFAWHGLDRRVGSMVLRRDGRSVVRSAVAFHAAFGPVTGLVEE
jgi:hypothetical protein